MFPLLSRLLLLSSLLLGLPLRKLLLALLAFEKRLYLREQDTGQRLHFMGGYSRTVVVDFLFSRHGPHPGHDGRVPAALLLPAAVLRVQ